MERSTQECQSTGFTFCLSIFYSTNIYIYIFAFSMIFVFPPTQLPMVATLFHQHTSSFTAVVGWQHLLADLAG
jgi:hypothetical protein